MRLLLPLGLFLSGLACKAPIELNDAPRIRISAPGEGEEINEGATYTFVIAITDNDGDNPVAVSVISSLDGELFAAEAVDISTDLSFEVDDLTPGSHTLTVAADDGNGEGSRNVQGSFEVNGKPTTPVISLTPLAPTPSDDLTAELVTPSADPEALRQIVYNWSWESSSGWRGDGVTLPAVVDSAVTNNGETWTFTLVAREGQNDVPLANAVPITVTASLVIDNAPPTPATTVEILPTSPHSAQDLRCEASGGADPEGETVTYEYAWAAFDGIAFADLPGATEAVLSAAFVEPSARLQCTAWSYDGGQRGDPLAAEVTVRDTLGTVATASVHIGGGGPDTGFGPPVALLDAALPSVTPVLAAGAPGLGLEKGIVGLFDSADLVPGDTLFVNDYQTRFEGDIGDRLGSVIRTIPDADGDGLSELLISSPGFRSSVSVVPAAALDLSAQPPLSAFPDIDLVGATLTRSIVAEPGRFGANTVGGDVDNDGIPEIFVMIDNGDDAALPNGVLMYNGADLVFGGTLRPSDAILIASDDLTDTFGVSMEAGHDFTGDGIGDLLVSGVRATPPNNPEKFWTAHVFSGASLTAHQTTLDAIVTIEHNPGVDAGTAAGFLDDLSGDDSAELYVSAPGAQTLGRVGVFLGGHAVRTSLEFSAFDFEFLIVGDQADGRFGEVVQSVGDLGSDGLSELAIAAPAAYGGAGAVYLFSGADLLSALNNGLNLTASDAAWVVVGESPGDGLTLAGPARDLDGDGVRDLVLASPGYLDASGNEGRIHVYMSGH